MATNLYVLGAQAGGGASGSDYQVVVHVAIPSANNLVNVNYQTAVANSKVAFSGSVSGIPFSGICGTTILPAGDGTKGTISAADAAAIAAGSLVEVVTTMRPTTGVLATLQTQIATFAGQVQTAVVAALQTQLQYFGYTA